MITLDTDAFLGLARGGMFLTWSPMCRVRYRANVAVFVLPILVDASPRLYDPGQPVSVDGCVIYREITLNRYWYPLGGGTGIRQGFDPDTGTLVQSVPWREPRMICY